MTKALQPSKAGNVKTQKARSPRSTKPTKRHVLKILEILSHGLTSGLGEPVPGKLCVEAAICLAYGLPHGDEPPCVGGAVRDFKIKLNDCAWPSSEARAEGMKGLAIAQLGSDTLEQMAFGKLMFLRGTQILLPFVFRKEAEKLPADKKAEIIEWADKLSAVTTFDEALKITRSASAYAYTHSYASAYAYAFAYASTRAYASASAYAYTHAYAYAYTYRHELLKLMAKVGLDVLIEMKSPGCKWLHLAKAPSVQNGNENR